MKQLIVVYKCLFRVNDIITNAIQFKFVHYMYSRCVKKKERETHNKYIYDKIKNLGRHFP